MMTTLKAMIAARQHFFGLENVVLTPHLGASTDEAQTAVSVDAAKAIVAYLKSGEIRGAVNAGGIKLDLPPDEAPFAKASRSISMLKWPELQRIAPFFIFSK